MPSGVKVKCCHCGKEKAETSYYNSNSDFYSNGKLPICKDCFSKKYAEYLAEYHSSKKAMQRMCMSFDIYFSEDLFDKCDTGDEKVVGRYFRNLNITQYQGKTFENSDEIEVMLSGERKISKQTIHKVDEYGNVEEVEEDIDPEWIEKWGEGFEPIDYRNLNSHYNTLKSSNPQTDINAEIFIQDLCYTKMQQMKAIKEGRVDDYKKLTEQYMKLFQQAGLKTVKESTIDENTSYGVNIETIEKYTPAEYYKNKKLFKDFDGLGDYIDRFIFRPVKNLMFGTRDRDEEYYVKAEEDVDIDDSDGDDNE